MKATADKSPVPQRQAAAYEAPPQQNLADNEFQFVDNRAETASLRQLQEVTDNSPQVQGLSQLKAMMNNSPRSGAIQSLQAMVDNSSCRASRVLLAESGDELVQRVEDEELLQGEFFANSPVQLAQLPDAKPNNTGLPDNLKAGVESLSGLSLDNVKVHYNSAEPAQLNAHAYAQGTDIHVGPGQEKHLPHEAWHVVQQAQGRVRPTMQMKDETSVNDDRGLEAEANLMGAKAVVLGGNSAVVQRAESDGLVSPSRVRNVGMLDLKHFVTPSFRGQLLDSAWPPSPALVEPIQRLSTTTANIAARWAYVGADPSYVALTAALQVYEAARTVVNAETLIDAAKAFRSVVGLAPRVTHHLGVLINDLYAESAADLRTAADQVRPATVNEQGVGAPRNATEDERIVGAAGALNTAPRQAEERDILRFRAHRGFAGAAMAAVAADDGPAIVQNWTARGDMYHVGAVLNLFPNLKVIIYDMPAPTNVTDEASHSREIEKAHRWKQATAIAGYYQQPGRVFYTHADGVGALASKAAAYEFHQSEVDNERAAESGMFIDVGGCTTILGLTLQHARSQGQLPQRRDELKEAVAPAPIDATRAGAIEIQHYLAQNGWQMGTPYVIINFRASGHAQIERQLQQAPTNAARRAVRQGYDPARDQEGGNHPDLDTGVVGVQELAQIVRAKGFTPVFMGEEPANAPQPHLIEYWRFQHSYAVPPALAPAPLNLCRGGRAAESYFLRVVAETYNVKLLAMRSGVTDQMAMLGIPVISIDIDNFHQAAVPELLNQPGYEVGQDEVAHSWARGSKLEAGLERDYGRVFIQDPRDLKAFRRADNKWQGGFRRRDKARIDDAVDFYFGTAQAPASPDQGIRHSSHPLHPDKLRATDLKGAADRQNLAAALPGKLDTSLNPDVTLRHAQVVLGAPVPNVVEADKFIDDLLARLRPSRGAVATDEIDHRVRQVRNYRELLGRAEAIYNGAGQNGQKYRNMITSLDDDDALNRVRLLRLQTAWLKISRQRDGIARFMGREGRARKLANQVIALDLIAQPNLNPDLERAERAVTAEGHVAFHARLLPLAQQAETLHSDLLRVAQAAVAQHTAQSSLYYSRPFKVLIQEFGTLQTPTAAAWLV